jgi:hypothetical protein
VASGPGQQAAVDPELEQGVVRGRMRSIELRALGDKLLAKPVAQVQVQDKLC